MESVDPRQGKVLIDSALAKLEALTVEEIRKAYNEWRLADILSQTQLTENTRQAVEDKIQSEGWAYLDVKTKLMALMAVLEDRNRKIAGRWLDAIFK